MSTYSILTRLQANWQEIPGVARAILLEPSQGIELADLPCVYPVNAGPMTFAVPSTSASFSIPIGAGQYVVERRYTYRLLIAQATSASVDSGDLGAVVNEEAALIIDAPIDYFMSHPRLNTATLGDVAQLVKDVTIQDGGITARQDPGGTWHICAEYTLTIAERRKPSPQRLS